MINPIVGRIDYQNQETKENRLIVIYTKDSFCGGVFVFVRFSRKTSLPNSFRVYQFSGSNSKKCTNKETSERRVVVNECNLPHSNDETCPAHTLYPAYIWYSFAWVRAFDVTHGNAAQTAALPPFLSKLIVDQLVHSFLNSSKTLKLLPI